MVLSYCVDRGLVYESLPYHNCVFIGKDENGTAGMQPFGGPTAMAVHLKPKRRAATSGMASAFRRASFHHSGSI